MDIRLAGFNIDRDGLDEIKTLLEQDALSEEDKKTALDILKNLTPETISAAYARISRDPRPLYELRKDGRSDVEGARKSNKAIIFTMGHKSVAEHAVFNFDIMGISRRAVEEIEEKRLQAYTEKSQRYITLDGDFVLPKEIAGTKFESEFLKLIEMQNNFYDKKLAILGDWHKGRDYSEMFKSLSIKDDDEKRKLGTLEGLGKEDARYALAQATQAQLGMTTSARNLEVLITKLRSSPITEFREIGEALFREVDGVAPSVIRYVEPKDYYGKTRQELRETVRSMFVSTRTEIPEEVVRLYSKLERDDSIIAGLIFASSFLSFEDAMFLTQNRMSKGQKLFLLQTADRYQESYDPKLREYELGDRVAQFTVSSSAFAQLKRHRMDTLIPQPYFPALGWTTPISIKSTGLEGEFDEVQKASNHLYKELIVEGLPYQAAEYVLTNATKRRVLFDSNNRQVHAFCMERENLPAQWDIRYIANLYHELIQKESPLTLSALTGKDKFYETKEKQQKDND